jgi:peptide/nickel transport system substrate-binding protein
MNTWNRARRSPTKSMTRLTPLLLSVSIACLAGCQGSADKIENVEPRNDSDTVVYPLYEDIKDWDPSTAFSTEVLVLANIYETLLRYDGSDKDQPIKPLLASRWESQNQGKTWIFHLRQDVVFHDGEKLNAAAVKASLNRTRELKRGPYYIWSAVSEIEVLDEYTVAIHTNEPTPIDLIAAAQYGAYIFSSKAAKQPSSWFQQGQASGTGPYRLAEWRPGSNIRLERFDKYWDEHLANGFRQVRLPLIREISTQTQMIESGAADFVNPTPVNLLPRFKRIPGISVRTPASWVNQQFLFNTDKYPTSEPAFRKALLHAWDNPSVIEYIYEGTAVAAAGAVPATMWGSDPSLTMPTFDLEKAKQLLIESGVPKSAWRMRAAFVGSSSEYTNSMLLYQHNLAQIGVTLELSPGPWGRIWSEARNPASAPHIQSMMWWPTYPTPGDWLAGLFRTEASPLFNLAYYSNPEFDDLVNAGLALEGQSRVQASEKYRAAQQILVDDAVAIFVADLRLRTVHRSEIGGLKSNPAYSAVFFNQLYLKELESAESQP